jgi:hypothetical protein
MQLRRYMTGEWGGGLIKLIAIAVFIMIGVPYLTRCAQEAPKVAANVASQAVDAAGNAISDMASSAVDAAQDKVIETVCDIPLVDKACTSPTDTAATDQTAAPAATIPKPPSSANTCLSKDQAAADGLARARACTRIAQVEFGGNLYAQKRDRETCYEAESPFMGEERSVVIPPVQRPGWTRAGTYHSHPRGGAGAYFSVADLCTYVSKKETGYVVSTEDYSIMGWTLPRIGNDGAVRRFDPNKDGTTFAASEVSACLAQHDSWSWLGFWTCPHLESGLDLNPRGVGTITKLDDLPRIADSGCSYFDKAVDPSTYPSCMHD